MSLLSREIYYFIALAIHTAVLALWLNACGTEPPPSSYSEPSIPVENLDDAIHSALKTKVYCDYNDGNCNPSLGMLVNTTDRSVGLCSAFLVTNQIIATNSHCIPKDIKSNLQNKTARRCQNRIWVFFPQTGNYAEEQIECDTLLHYSAIEDNRVLPDFAFLLLKSTTQRPSLAVSTQGFENEKFYELLKIDPVVNHGIPSGYMRKTQCQAIYDTLYVNNQGLKNTPNITMALCNIYPGNSGSPILDEKGKVHGMIQSKIDKDQYTRMLQMKSIPLTEGRLENINFASSFSCIRIPPQHLLPLPESCTLSPPNHSLTDLPEFKQPSRNDPDLLEFHRKIRNEMETLSWEGKNLFFWKATPLSERALSESFDLPSAYDQFYIPLPRCIPSLENLLDQIRQKEGSKRAILKLPSHLPSWSLRNGFDRFLRPQLSFERGKTTNSRQRGILEINPHYLRSSGKVSVSLIEFPFLSDPFTLSLEICR